MYTTGDLRNNQILAACEAIKKAITDISPKDKNGTVIPVYMSGDDAEIVEITYPCMVIFQPEFIIDNFTKNSMPFYRDYDLENLEVKEFPEPIHGKLRFEVHALATNPDNDAILQTFMLRCRRAIKELWTPVYRDGDLYDRLPLYWRNPEDYALEDGGRVRVYPVDAFIHIEFMEYRKARLIDPIDPVLLTYGEYTHTGYYIKDKLAHSVQKDDVIVYVVGNTKDFPLSGECEFEDGTSFTYTGKTYKEFTGVSGITRFHCFGEVIRFKS